MFNSRFHEQSVFDALPPFLAHFPEYNELGTIGGLEAKSSVIPVGIDGDWLAGGGEQRARATANGEPPLVIWNQRWEYDKNPGQFLDAIRNVATRGTAFRLALFSPRELKQFMGADIRLVQVRIRAMSEVSKALSFYMGKNTPARKDFIVANLISEAG